MEKITVNTSGSLSDIYVGTDWKDVSRLLPHEDVVIITDTTVHGLYGSAFPEFPVIIAEPGEKSKNLKTVEKIAGQVLKSGLGRNGFILAVGGGVICDLAGFIASVYMRGVRCGYVSTTLLSQVDASTGGKTGVNLGVVKNVIGTFSQPEFVICDTSMLETLKEEEYLSGLSELIKTGLIGDKTITDILERHYEGVMSRDRDLMSSLVAKAVRFKASVVAEDEKEGGLRRILNFGHTFGHALELRKELRHGFAVAEGMKLATLFSYEKDLITRDEYERIVHLLDRYRLTGEQLIPVRSMRKLIAFDKKRTGQEIHFVFLETAGRGIIKKLPVEEVIAFYSRVIKINKGES